MQDLSFKIAKWASECSFEDLPAASIQAIKTRLIDTLAVSWAGSSANGIAELRAMLLKRGGRGDSSLLVYGERIPSDAAALFNGAMAAALDFDGLHQRSGVHTDIVVLPAVLATAERHDASGKEILTALCVGEEILIRLGLSVPVGPGWFYSSVLGVFAATLAVGKIQKLDPQTMNAALGVALCHASGSQQNLVENCLTKRLQTGFAAQAAVLAADLAAAGISGPMESLEGKFGLSALYGPIDPVRVTHRLGTWFEMESLTIKKYPSCFCNHAAIEAAIRLADAHNLSPNDILSVTTVVPPFVERLVGKSYSCAEATQVTAQFNLSYSIACSIFRRAFTLAEIEPENISNREIEFLAQKVAIQVDAGNENKFAPVTVTIDTRSGARHTLTIKELPGSPENPLSRQEILSKAEQCFSLGARPLNLARIHAIIDMVQTFDEISDIRQLMLKLH